MNTNTLYLIMPNLYRHSVGRNTSDIIGAGKDHQRLTNAVIEATWLVWRMWEQCKTQYDDGTQATFHAAFIALDDALINHASSWHQIGKAEKAVARILIVGLLCFHDPKQVSETAQGLRRVVDDVNGEERRWFDTLSLEGLKLLDHPEQLRPDQYNIFSQIKKEVA